MDMVDSNTRTPENELFDTDMMKETLDDEMALSEHIEEFSQRLIFCLVILIIATLICFADVKEIVKIFQAPAIGIKFLQFSPGEFFFASIKIAAFCGILISSPALIYQILLYILPGMTKNERNIVLPVIFSSSILFIIGLLFSYFFLVPAALTFFINYGADIVEPFWSFDQYFEFIIVLLFSTAIAFQLPVIQVMLGLLKIVSGTTMLSIWRYVILGSTVVGAVLTPSVDPLTQILMSMIVLVLYFTGAGIVVLVEKSRQNINY